MEFIQDTYSQTRGGRSRLLAIRCRKCNTLICHYQKDGPGALRRMYLDRIIEHVEPAEFLICPNCARQLGLQVTFQKENRPAYRMFVDAVVKKIVSKKNLGDIAK